MYIVKIDESNPLGRPLTWEGDGGPEHRKGQVLPALAHGWYYRGGDNLLHGPFVSSLAALLEESRTRRGIPTPPPIVEG